MKNNNLDWGIQDIEDLKYNWDGREAVAIPPSITSFIKKLLEKLGSKPYIFPCSIPGVALQYKIDKDNELLLIFNVSHVMTYRVTYGRPCITKEEQDIDTLSELINNWIKQRTSE